MARNARIPDVPQMQSPGLSEFLQAVRREIVSVGDELTQLEDDIQAEIDKPFTVRPFRQIFASDGVRPTDLGGVIQVMTASITLTLPNPSQLTAISNIGYGQTVEVISYSASFSIVGAAACSLVNSNTGALSAPGVSVVIAASNRLVLTSGYDSAWWFEVAH